MPKHDFTNAYNKWNVNEERRLIRLKLVKDNSFDEISEILKRSPRALKLRFCLIVDKINWKAIKVSAPISVNLNPMEAIVQLLLEGSTPHDIALKWPRQFIDNHTGIVSLWEHLQKKQWRHIS
mgnify:CR=1 FL=1